MEFHLNFCRRCRTRQASLEAAGNNWKQGCLGSFELSAERVAIARSNFLARVAADQTVSGPPLSSSGWAMGMRVGLIAAAVACAVMASIGVWSVRQDRAVVRKSAVPVSPKPRVPHPQAPASPQVPVQTARANILPEPIKPAVTQPADAREIEIDLLWAVHEQRLCRTGSVDVVLRPSGLLAIRGVVETGAQLEELKTLAAEEAHGPFAMDVRTTDEFSAPRLFLPVPAAAPSVVPAVPRSRDGERLIRLWLKGRTLTEDEAVSEVNRISNQAVRLANEAWVEGWALQRLVDRFPVERRDGLKLASRARLSEMVQSHFAGLEKSLTQERDLLLPIIGNDDPSPSAASGTLFADVARLSALIQDTFAGTSPDGHQIAGALRRTLNAAAGWGNANLAAWDTRPER